MTASVWTPTPPPTATPTPTPIPSPTPTPVPYGLTVSIVEEDETPIAGAQIVLAEVEEDDGIQTADDSGMAAWSNLPGETVSLAVSAQGYIPTNFSGNIDRGDNQMVVILAKDPHGILPSEACAPGENLLYVEDFQDGEAQDWPPVELRAEEWDVIPYPDVEENVVLFKPVAFGGGAWYVGSFFENAVWRMKFMPVGKLMFAFNWHWHNQYEVDGETVDWSAYQIWFHPPAIRVFRAQPPLSTVTLREVERVVESGVWHDIEMSFFEGTVEFWIDGVRFLSYEDPKPWPRGGITIDVGLDETLDADALIYFDDAVVCELTAPFVPMPTPEPAQ
jgi:hypothetical protein